MAEYIDWEQRRYELAKAAMQGFCANHGSSDWTDKMISPWAVKLADEMIKQLKETSDGKI